MKSLSTNLAAGLFGEDFDLIPRARPETDAAKELAERAEREAALARAFADGVREGAAQAAAERDEAMRHLLTACADQLRAAEQEANRVAGDSADAIAQALFRVLATLLPASCARMGPVEVAAIARDILPALAREPDIAVQLNPRDEAAFDAALARLAPELRERLTLRATDAIAPGDIRVVWSDGKAVRSTATAWEAIVAVLERFGFLEAGEQGREQFESRLRARLLPEGV